MFLRLPSIALAVSAAALLALGGCQSGDTDADGFKVSEDISQIEGIWKARGYGWTLAVSPEGFQVFDAAGSYCALNTDLSGPAEEFPAPFFVSPDGQALKLMIEDPAYKYAMDKVAALPDTCAEASANDPAAVFEAFDTLFRTHYAFFETRGVDWPAVSDAARAKISDDMSEAALFDVLSGAVNQIDDGHVSLVAEIDGERTVANPGRGKTTDALKTLADTRGEPVRDLFRAWRAAVQSGVETEILGGKGTVAANGWIRYGMIEGDIGYLSIMTETNYTKDGDDHAEIENVMNDAMAAFDGAEAVIVDISLNHGGEDGISRRIARRFAAEQTLGYSKRAGDASDAPMQDIFIRPDPALASFTGPVYLLTSDHTVSAGEILTMSMRALPNVTHVGEATRGALSDILTKPLPNGWELNLSNEIYADGQGKLWEGKGIAPEIDMPVYSQADPFKGHVEAVAKVAELIKTSR